MTHFGSPLIRLFQLDSSSESDCDDPATTKINIDEWLHEIEGKEKDDFVDNPEIFQYDGETSYRFTLGWSRGENTWELSVNGTPV